MGDEALLRDCIEACLLEAPRLMAAIHEAISMNDGDALERSAHSLQGSISFLHVNSATQCAQQLESAGANGDVEFAQVEAETLDKHLKSVIAAMSAFLEGETEGDGV